MIASMTGFARVEGAEPGPPGWSWAWELRSVNGRGLELRLRLPPGLEGLEGAIRAAAGATLKRGNVIANLTVKREESGGPVPDPAALEAMLALVAEVARRIPGAPPPRAEAVLALPGVWRPAAAPAEEGVAERQTEAARQGFERALAALAAARREEGARLATILAGLLDEIEDLGDQAARAAAEQPARIKARLMEMVGPLLADLPALPLDRVGQEVAVLAARADVREELDRLASHVAGARSLLAEDGAVGRRLEFLVQEFHREANTLCGKSASVALTGIGLRLKAAIEQLREQVANIE
jgi:uncharacterized protein (TIGR00255 family)